MCFLGLQKRGDILAFVIQKFDSPFFAPGRDRLFLAEPLFLAAI